MMTRKEKIQLGKFVAVSFGSALVLFAVLVFTGCATRALQNEARAQLSAAGFTPAPYGNNHIMVADTEEARTISGGKRGVRVADVARQNHPVLYPLAWVFDYIGLPTAVGYGGYKLVEEINDSDSPSRSYKAGGDQTIYESKTGPVTVDNSNTESWED